MDKVKFTSLEHNGDIIISFSFDEGTEFGIDGFIIQRNPELDLILDKDEQGACIEWEDYDDIRVLLDEVHITRKLQQFQSKLVLWKNK